MQIHSFNGIISSWIVNNVKIYGLFNYGLTIKKEFE